MPPPPRKACPTLLRRHTGRLPKSLLLNAYSNQIEEVYQRTEKKKSPEFAPGRERRYGYGLSCSLADRLSAARAATMRFVVEMYGPLIT